MRESDTICPFEEILPPETFGIVHHRALNDPLLDKRVGSLLAETEHLGHLVPERQVFAVVEGDLLQTARRGRGVFTHHNFSNPSERRWERLRKAGTGTCVESALSALWPHRDRIVLCIELKKITQEQTILETVSILHEAGFRRVYFDSFYPGKLAMVQAANGQTGAHYGTSLHVAGFWRNKRWGLGSGFPFDLHTVPYPTHWGLPRGPTIFGAVSSPAFFEDFAHHPEVRGAYIRFQESTFWEMALTSMSNRPKKRP